MKLILRRHLRLLLAVSLLATPAAAFAQITMADAPGVYPAYTHRNTVAFDPVNDVYFMIVWDPPNPAMAGRFLNKAGVAITADFPITDEIDNQGYATWTSIAAGGPPNDPAFIVTYLVTMDGTLAIKYARLVRFINGVPSVSPRTMVVDVGPEWFAAEKAQTYWNGQRFVVGSRLIVPGFSLPSPVVSLVDMALNVSPYTNLGDGADFYGSPALACSPTVCLAVGFKAGVSGGYSGGTYGRLFSPFSLAPQGTTMIPLNPLGANEDQAVVYQKHTGMFLAHWFRVSGGYIDTRLVLPDGSLGPTNQAAGPNGGMNAFSYNQHTQTTLLLTKDSLATLYAFELGDNGLPIRPANILTVTEWDFAINDYVPAIAANEEDGQWLVAFRLAASSFGRLITGTYVDPTTVPLVITSSSALAEATITVPYARLLLASGGVIPYTWTLISGAIPPGINLNGAFLSGTPTMPGTYNFRMRVTSTDAQVAEKDFTLVVQAIVSVPPGAAGAHIDGATPLYLSQALGKRNNLAYDPINRVYLMTISDGQMPIVGRWVDRNGLINWAPDFVIADDVSPSTGELEFMGFFGVTFGGPPSDPVFLVTYLVADLANNTKYGRFVRYSNGTAIVSARFPIVDVFTQWQVSEKAQSFWNGQRFIVGTRVMWPGHSQPTPQVQVVDLAGNVSAPVVLGDGADFYGSPALTCATNGVCITVGFKAGIPEGYAGGTYMRRFNSTTLAPIGPLVTLASGSPNEDQGVVYQTHTGNFLVQWWRLSGADGYIDTRLVATDGSMSLLDLSRGIGPGAGDNALAFNEGTRTSLLVTKQLDNSLIVMELGDDGYPVNPGNTVVITPWDGVINAFYPSVAADSTDRKWLVTARLSAGTVGRIIQGSPTGTSIPLQNWSFGLGMTGWTTFAQGSNFVTSVNGGVLSFYREPLPPGQTGQGAVLQALGTGFPAETSLTASFAIGNSSTVRKRIIVIIHDLDFADLQVCTFWLAAGAPLRTYQMRTHTNQAWANGTISFYAATPGSDGGAYLLDNVQLYSIPGTTLDRTECVDPLTPAPVAGPDSGTLLVNGDFNTGLLAPWGLWGQITSQIAGGVFEFARPAGVPAGAVLQATGVALPTQTRFTATMSLGNSSPVRRRVAVIIHDLDFTDLSVCSFWLESGQALSTYVMKGFTTRAWTNAVFAVYPSDVNTSQWIRLDNVTLQTTPSAPLVGTECVEPGAGVGSAPLAGTAAAAAGSSGEGARSAGSGGIAAQRGPADGGASAWQALATDTGTQAFVWATPIDLRDANAPWLRFDSQLSDGASDAFVEVTRDGVNWTRVAAVPPTEGWASVSVDLAEFAGDIIYVRFVYAGVAPVGGTPVEAWAIRGIYFERGAPRTVPRRR